MWVEEAGIFLKQFLCIAASQVMRALICNTTLITVFIFNAWLTNSCACARVYVSIDCVSLHIQHQLRFHWQHIVIFTYSSNFLSSHRVSYNYVIAIIVCNWHGLAEFLKYYCCTLMFLSFAHTWRLCSVVTNFPIKSEFPNWQIIVGNVS